MNSDHEKEFEHHVNQLVRILKKLVKNLPNQGKHPQIPSTFKDAEGNIHLNLYFAFFPFAPEDMDEFEEFYDELISREEKPESSKFHLNAEDREFLKRHGLSF
ncbi:MAG: hypothetical protein JW893_01935 [Candidatus Omnitrophica bacterium]|nr:hypothetical protein [Candidatus Omnitrophota bacterium]